MLLILLYFVALCCGKVVLWDFTTNATTSSFSESSDTVRNVGMSKATFSLIESQEVRRAVLQTLLNPQPNGACFAGVESALEFPDWSSFMNLSLVARGQGEFSMFKVVLRDQDGISSGSSFEKLFQASGSFAQFDLALNQFGCVFRGKSCDSTLDVRAIEKFGLQAAGLFDSSPNEMQKGAAALEVKSIWLS